MKETTAARVSRPGVQGGKRVSGLRLASLAATIMLLVQIGLGFAIAQAVNVPRADQGSGIFREIGRALSNGPLAITLHAALGLILVITAISVTIRAILARRGGILALSVIGLAAVVAANISGAKFVGSGQDSSSSLMAVDGVVAIFCYVLCLAALSKRRRRRS